MSAPREVPADPYERTPAQKAFRAWAHGPHGVLRRSRLPVVDVADVGTARAPCGDHQGTTTP